MKMFSYFSSVIPHGSTSFRGKPKIACEVLSEPDMFLFTTFRPNPSKGWRASPRLVLDYHNQCSLYFKCIKDNLVRWTYSLRSSDKLASRAKSEKFYVATQLSVCLVIFMIRLLPELLISDI